MQAHCTRLTIARLLSHVEDEAMISDLSRRLDEAFASFMVGFDVFRRYSSFKHHFSLFLQSKRNYPYPRNLPNSVK